ncbi:MAG: GIY-YIG nuclease family protein [Patescibacteria group bacterium]
MRYFVYIVRCADSSYYTGITWNLKKRIEEHNKRIKTPLQKSKIPVNLVYWQIFSDKIPAARREKEIKGWSRLKKEKLIESLHRGRLATEVRR